MARRNMGIKKYTLKKNFSKYIKATSEVLKKNFFNYIKMKIFSMSKSKTKVKRANGWPGAVAHTCNPALWEAEAGGSPEVRSSRLAWPIWRNPVFTKSKKLATCSGRRL